MIKIQTQSFLIHQNRLRFYFWGSPKKPLILMLHGWMDTGASFHFLNQFLAKKFYCVAFDMRGYAKSQHSRNPLGYFFYDYLADLHQIIETHFSKRKVILLGHSLGGAITSAYAGSFPKKISKFINLEGFVFQSQSKKTDTQRIHQWLSQLDNKKFKIYPNKKTLVSRLQLANPEIPQDKIEWLVPYLSKKTKEGYVFSSDPKHKLIEPHSFSKENFYSCWQAIHAPSLFVYAEASELYKIYLKQHLKRDQKYFPPKTQCVGLPNIGHMMHLEAPELLAKEIFKFL